MQDKDDDKKGDEGVRVENHDATDFYNDLKKLIGRKFWKLPALFSTQYFNKTYSKFFCLG